CRIIANQDNSEIAYEFMVHTRPIHLNNQVYTLFAIDDISDQKRREALERIFFHDVLNTAGVVHGIAQMLPEIDEEAEQIELVGILQNSAQQLIDEIKAQRELRHAEDGNLEPILENISVNNIIERVINLYKNHPLVNEQKIISEVLPKDITFVSDKTLLVRSLGNLMKNAIEASIPGDTVKLYPVLSDTSIIFNIYNERVIPNNIQLQLFQRSFSTKQKAGRGIGLYSVKLIIEQYLKGKVSFISDEKSKTIFSVSIPIIN
ncbi:MAG: GHKL domain-containing protein, partial [Ignavibacteria bacterium]|nr:GHKL domain-containing protein [Ignavibacteria bacterium]